MSLYSLSPQQFYSDHGNYQEIRKHGAHVYCMAPWDWDGLEICREPVFPSLSVDIVEKIYSQIGGIPGYVSEAAQAHSGLIIEQVVFRRIQEALDHVQGVPSLLQCIA